jgi:hypothetical protein
MEFRLVIRFIDRLQVVTANNNNSIADFHPTNHSTFSSQPISTSLHYPFPGNGFITGTVTSNHYEVFLPFLVQSPRTADSIQISNSLLLRLLITLLFSLNFGTQLLHAIFCVPYKRSARTTKKTQLFSCDVHICWGSAWSLPSQSIGALAAA